MRHLNVAFACLLACHGAHADRSRLADESDVADAGDCEFEFAGVRRTARGSAAAEHERALRLACGVGRRTELGAELTRLGAAHAFAIDARTVLQERRDAGTGWTLAYGLAAERAAGERWRRSEHFVAIEASRQLAPTWWAEARIAAVRDRLARARRAEWTLAVEHTLAPALEVRAELDGEARGSPWVGVGLRLFVWPEHALLALTCATRSRPTREHRLGVGITFEF